MQFKSRPYSSVRRRITIYFPLWLLCILHFNYSPAQPLEVCHDCELQSIRKAIEVALPHDSIIIKPGTYRESNIRIDKPITLIGIGFPVIDGENQGEIIGLYADSIIISGLEIKNVGISHTRDHAAVHLYKSNYFTIENNKLFNPFFGILVEKSHHGIIRNNEVTGSSLREFDSGNGIHLWHCSDVLITNNRLSGMRDGIYLEFVEGSRVLDNISRNNIRYGLHFMFSNNDDYIGNVFENNGAGVAVMFSKFINMKNNTFVRNWGQSSFGLLLKEIYDATIENNLFRENTVGISTDGSSRINYKNNDFIRNGWAVRVTGGCYTNIFTRNNFMGNSFDVSYNSKVNDNKFENNYWSSYSGYDLDRDGIGDVPFRPVNLFSYVVNRSPESIVLLRSLFVDIVNFSEKVSPVFTPDNLMDESPSMKELR